MVINIGWVKDGKDAELEDEIRQIHAACNGHILKVIIETCLLTEEEKIRMCEIVTSILFLSIVFLLFLFFQTE